MPLSMRRATPRARELKLDIDAALLKPRASIALPGEQIEAHRLRAFVFDLEITRHRGRGDVKRMRLTGPPVGQHPELESCAINLRLVSQNDGGRSCGGDSSKLPLRREVGVEMRNVVQKIEFGAA